MPRHLLRLAQLVWPVSPNDVGSPTVWNNFLNVIAEIGYCGEVSGRAGVSSYVFVHDRLGKTLCFHNPHPDSKHVMIYAERWIESRKAHWNRSGAIRGGLRAPHAAITGHS